MYHRKESFRMSPYKRDKDLINRLRQEMSDEHPLLFGRFGNNKY